MTEMKFLHKRKKTFLVLGVVLFVSFFVASVYLPKVSAPVVVEDKDVVMDDGSGSVFQRHTDDQTRIDDSMDEDTPVKELQRIINSKDQTYWLDWSYDKKMVLGVIQEVDIANNQMKIIITLPKGRVFSDINRIAYVDCPLERSGLIKGSEAEQTEQERGVDILRTAAPQDRLYAYCLDEGCLNLGDVCILTDMSL